MVLFIACLVLYIAFRLMPYLFSSVPLGYDAGLYLYLLKEYQKLPILSYTSLSEWAIRQFPVGIAVIGRLLTSFVSPEKLLVPLIVGFCILLFVAVYMFSRHAWGKKQALWSVLFLSVSAIQFHTYWYYYAKQILASSFLLFALYFFLRSSYWAILFGIGIAYIHEPTFIMFCVALVSGFIVEKSKRTYYAIVLFVTAVFAGMYYFPYYHKTIEQYVAPVLSSLVPKQAGGRMFTPSGTFYDVLPALLFMLPYIPFAIIGILKQWKNKKMAPALGALLGSLVIVVFGVFLSRRFIIFFDLFMITFAGYGIVYAVEKWRKVRFIRLMVMLYIGVLIGFISIYVYKTGSPPIVDDELSEIALLRQTEPDAFVLVTDNEYMPWVYGWSERKTIAPGYGQYDTYWTSKEWHAFWESGDRKIEHELLLKLPKPLYIFAGDHQRQYVFELSGECFARINWRTYKFICNE